MAYIYDLVDTWNDGATTFTAVKMNVTDTASNAASLLMDLQVGGASKFSVSKAGNITSAGYFNTSASQAWISTANSANARLNTSGLKLAANTLFGWTDTVNESNAALDIILRRKGAANLALGAADTTGTTAPTPQFLSVQSWSSSTTFDQLGANFTIDGSQGTGQGAGGSIIFRVAPAGGTSNGVQNGLVAALTINPTGTVSIGGMTINPGNGATTFLQTFGITMQTTNAFVIRHGNGDGLDVRPVSSGFPNIQLKNASNAIQAGLWGEATNTLALRNGGTNASPVSQQFNVYKFWVSSTDYSRLEVGNSADANTHYLYATQSGTGTARDLLIGTSGAKDLLIYTNGSLKWTVNSSGHLLAGTDNLYDIGASGATRPRNIYAGTGVVVGNVSVPITLSASGNGRLLTSGNTVQIGLASSSGVALNRSSTTLEVQLGDLTGYTNIKGKLTTDTNYTAGTFTATGYLTLYDAAGTAYRVPCAV